MKTLSGDFDENPFWRFDENTLSGDFDENSRR
jgi:hypothetical protein